jgi:hypothetical protein
MWENDFDYLLSKNDGITLRYIHNHNETIPVHTTDIGLPYIEAKPLTVNDLRKNDGVAAISQDDFIDWVII